MEWAISRNIVSKTLKACRFTSLEDVRPENYDKKNKTSLEPRI